MKKKFMALACIVLVVALTCSLFACSKTMFDGRYTKEATAEQAKQAWTSADSAVNGTSRSAVSTDNGAIKGWTGMKMEVNSDMNIERTMGDETFKSAAKTKISGAALFDASAISINGEMSASNSRTGRDTETFTMNAGLYVKDNMTYASMASKDKTLQFKFETKSIAAVAFQQVVASVTDTMAEASMELISAVLDEFDFEMLAELGIKAYIDDSGDYNRIKFVFSVEAIAELQDIADEDLATFKATAAFKENSLIIVTDKSNVFQGAKLSINYAFDGELSEGKAKLSMNAVSSLENIAEVTDYPKDLDSYKDIKDISINDLEGMFDF